MSRGARCTPDAPSLVVLFGLDWLVPFATYPIGYWDFIASAMGVVWTLAAEVTFYAMAPWLLRSTRTAVALLIVSFATRLVVFWIVGYDTPTLYVIWSYFFFPATLMFFPLGHFAQQLGRRYPIGLPGSLIALALAALLSSLEGTPTADFPISYGAAISFAISLPAYSRRRKTAGSSTSAAI